MSSLAHGNEHRRLRVRFDCVVFVQVRTCFGDGLSLVSCVCVCVCVFF